MTRRSVTRRIGAGAAVAAVLALVLVGLFRVEVQTSLESLLPDGDPALQAYTQTAENFGGDPIVVLLESSSTSTDSFLTQDRLPLVIQLEGALSKLDGVAAVYGPGTLLNQIAARAQDFLAELTGRRDAEIALAKVKAEKRGASPAEVKRAGQRAQEQFDSRYGPLLVGGLPGGLPTLSNETFVERAIFGDAGEPRGQWRFVVPKRDAVAILVRPSSSLDAAASARLVDDIRQTTADIDVPGAKESIAGVPVLVSGLSERAERDASVLGIVAVLAIGACLMLAVWLPRTRRLVPLASTLLAIALALAMTAPLGLPVSLAVIAFCPVLLGIGCYYPTYLAMGASTRTVLVVAAATACSLGTLSLSPIPLVGDLGVVLGLGVVLSVLVALPLRRFLRASSHSSAYGLGTEPRRLRVEPVAPAARWALGALVVLAVAGWAALPGIRIQSDVDHFAGGLAELSEARHVEDILGSSGQVSVVVTGANVLTPEAIRWMQAGLDDLIASSGDRVRAVLSPSALLGFLGKDASEEEVDAAWRLLPDYLTRAIVSHDRSQAVLVFGIRVDDLDSVREAKDAIARSFDGPPADLQVSAVGLPFVLLAGEEKISDDRFVASIAGVGTAIVVLFVGLRRRSDALRALVAALVATGLGYLLIAGSGLSLSPITVGLGALTTAVGCEFTIVLAESRRRGVPAMRSGVGLAALTSATGYLVLLASGLEVVRAFGLLLTGSVVLGFAASWLVVAATIGRLTNLELAVVEKEKEMAGV